MYVLYFKGGCPPQHSPRSGHAACYYLLPVLLQTWQPRHLSRHAFAWHVCLYGLSGVTWVRLVCVGCCGCCAYTTSPASFQTGPDRMLNSLGPQVGHPWSTPTILVFICSHCWKQCFWEKIALPKHLIGGEACMLWSMEQQHIDFLSTQHTVQWFCSTHAITIKIAHYFVYLSYIYSGL